MTTPGPTPSRREFLGATGAALLGAAALPTVAAPLPPDRKIRMGVVGGGFGSSFQWHLDPNCIVEAVSDLRPARRAHLQRVYKCPKAYESLEKLVLDPKIDAVAVFTGAPDHPRHVRECFKHGKHVISAVPACLTLEEAAQMKEAKEKTGLKYMMAETSYYRFATTLARQLWADGAFGSFLYSEVEYYHYSPKDYSKNRLWYYKAGRTWRYGFPPMLYPTHSTGFHVGVTRERFNAVSCLGWGPDIPQLKDNAYNNPFRNQVALFRTNANSICRCNVCWHLWAGGERAQWLGTSGSLYMPSAGGQPFTFRSKGRSDLRAIPDYFQLLPKPMRVRTGHGNSHTFLTHEFVSALVQDREPAVDLYESLAMTVPGIVAMESSRKHGEQLKIPSFDKS